MSKEGLLREVQSFFAVDEYYRVKYNSDTKF